MAQRRMAQRWQWRRWRRPVTYGLLLVIGCLGCWLLRSTPVWSSTPPSVPIAQAHVPATLQQGEQLYTAGRLTAAAQVLQQVVATATDPATQIVALRNLALVYRQLGQWAEAEAAIAAAQTRLTTAPLSQQPVLQAQLLDVQGGIQLDQGQGEAAIQTWQQAADLYMELGRPEALVPVQLHQVQAMQQLGFHRQAIATLVPLVAALTPQPDTLTEAIALRLLGESLMQVGNLEEAETALVSSRAIATALPDPAAASAAALSLGNLQAAQGETSAALAAYAAAMAPTAPPLVQVQAQLNRLTLWAKTGQTSQVRAQWSTVLAQLNDLPPNQANLFAKINLAQTLITLPVASNPDTREIADLLAGTIQQARTLGDRRSESYATGTLGHLYETLGQRPDAISLSQLALVQAQEINATDITYRWQWQLGRLYKAENKNESAIAAYRNAVNTLKVLRTDLVAVNPAVQVSFQENVEPIHRELVSLLLDPNRSATSQDLETARDTIESLQLAELDNFFREACLDAAAIDIDQLDQRAAVIYPVILGDRLEVIVSLPNQSLRHYASMVSSEALNQTVEQLQQFLVLRVGRQYLPYAQQVYDWMMRPLAADLNASEVDTLVFVLDGELRNIPMAALHDGQQFLLEKYSIALTPGLQLVNPQPFQADNLRVLTAGLSEARQGFSALPNVVDEVTQIQASASATAVLLNDGFTVEALERNLALEGTPVVHLASHGKFSSSSRDTFVLTWDDRLDIPTLNNLLQTAELNQNGPVELLVLSACQTAAGDKLAALGLAGMAVRSGARSTIATLWQVNDEATSILMSELYSNLANKSMTKAEALRQAQLKVLQNPRYRQHPFFWAPYILVGNWL